MDSKFKSHRLIKRPHRRQRPNVRLLEYVVSHVQATTEDIDIPNTYKQA